MTPRTRVHTDKAKDMDMHHSPQDLQRIAAEAEARIRLVEMETEARMEKWQHIMNEDIGYPDGIPVADVDQMDDYLDKSTAYIYERRIYANANREPRSRTATRNVLETSSNPNLNSNSQSRNQKDSIRQDPRLRCGGKIIRPSGEKENNSKQVMPSTNDAKHTIAVSAPSAKSYELERPKATPKSCRVPCEMKPLQNPWSFGNLSPPATIHSDDEEKTTAPNTNPSSSTTIDTDDDGEERTTPYSSLPKGQHPLPPLPPQNTHTQENRRKSTTDNEMEVDIDDSWQMQVDEKGPRPTKRRRRDGGNGKN